MSHDAFDEFADDYFAECDEHLAAVRRLLLALDTRAFPTLELTELGELGRRLHTLKGLSGMVGLLSAEEVAHALEDVVRAGLVPGDSIAPGTLDLLFAGVTLLDRCVQSKRGYNPEPNYGEFIRRAEALAAGTTPSSPIVVSTGAPPSRDDDGDGHGESLYRFEFTPSPEHAARGVGVELIRQRLQRIGAIVRTTPRARPGGAVTFEFVVRMPQGERPPEEWLSDGLQWETQRPSAAIIPRPAAAAGTETTEPVSASAAATSVVRVELARVNDLMRMIGEMVVLRSRLDDTVRRANGSRDWDDVRETNLALERQLRSLREGVMRIRLVQVGEVFERMRFAMRDVLRESGKSVRLEFEGEDTQIDKLIVDRMLEPLLHLVRNAASHGIESVSTRVARGKPAEARIVLRARAAGDRIVLEAEDDGAGIDVERVRERASQVGITAGQRALSDDELLDVICAPGFSTRDSADLSSGRGVGMGVVRSTIRALGGELTLVNSPGHGTRFVIELPLTLMIADALLVEVGGQIMAVPQLAMREILRLDTALVTALENSEVISYRGTVLPLLTLHRIFNMRPAADARPHVLVVGSETQPTGLVVDRLIGLREIVVHPITDPLLAIPGISAATELADGRISLIIDVAALLRRSRDAIVRDRARRGLPEPQHAAGALGGGGGA